MCFRSARNLVSAWEFMPTMLLVASTVLAAAPAKQPDPNEPMPQTRTFFIDGVKSEADVKAITDAVMKVKSVTKVDQLTPISGYANISFDHHAVTHQQIAQAIADAGPFRTTFRFVIPDYAAHPQQVDAIFAKVKDEVQIEATNKEKGEFTLRFLSLVASQPGPHGIGFNLGQILHPISDPKPQGLGLKMVPVSSNAAKQPVAKKAVAK
jgi:copper chaperone CopZ